MTFLNDKKSHNIVNDSIAHKSDGLLVAYTYVLNWILFLLIPCVTGHILNNNTPVVRMGKRNCQYSKICENYNFRK